MKPHLPTELIGQTITFIESTNPSHVGVQGTVIDETKNTLVLEVAGEAKTFMKSNIKFKILSSGQMVDGKSIQRRPEDRLKK
jgi:ribonuclease P protein subunit POP4